MPNWCENRLTVSVPDTDYISDLEAFIEKVRLKKTKDNASSAFSLQALLPIPQALEETVSQVPNEEHDSKRNVALRKRYGSDNWYDWNNRNWGTKWDVEAYAESRTAPTSIKYNFDSAWAPPIEAIKKIALLFPTLAFELEYCEPGMCFSGIFTANNDDYNDDYREGVVWPEFESEEDEENAR